MFKIKPRDAWASMFRYFALTSQTRQSVAPYADADGLAQAMRTALRMRMLDGLDLRAVVRVFSVVEGFAEILLVERLPTPRLGVA